MDLKLTHKRAFVSGSTAGIGRAIAAALAREGAVVTINGRKPDDVARAVDELKRETGGAILGFAGDFSRDQTCDALARQLPDVDILVNNVGIFEPVPFDRITDDDWRRFFEVNVLSGVRLSRLYLPGMKQRDWGRILFISSESGIQIPAEMIHYGMTKSAQIAVARGLAESLKGTKITVNSVLPGPTASRGVNDFVDSLAKEQNLSYEAFEEKFFDEVRPSSLIQRFAEPDEVASMVAYLASPLAAATTGSSVRVDGGVVRSAF